MRSKAKWPVFDEPLDLEGQGLGALPTAITASVPGWLRELGLPHLEAPVLRWCDEMGAICLEEVAEWADKLAAALGLDTPEASRLQAEAKGALARSQKAREAASPPADASGGETPAPPVWQANEFWPLPTPTHRAKREKKDRRRRSAARDAPEEEEAAAKSEEWLRLHTQITKEEEQRKQEAVDKLKAAISAALSASTATEGTCWQDLARALEGMEEVGLPSEGMEGSHDLVAEARQSLEKMRRRYNNACTEALLRLQAALEERRDDSFGDIVRDAVVGADAVLVVVDQGLRGPGDAGSPAHEGAHREAETAAETAEGVLRRWEEARVALHMALRQRCADALRTALEDVEDSLRATSRTSTRETSCASSSLSVSSTTGTGIATSSTTTLSSTTALRAALTAALEEAGLVGMMWQHPLVAEARQALADLGAGPEDIPGFSPCQAHWPTTVGQHS